MFVLDITDGNMFLLVITIGNRFLQVITLRKTLVTLTILNNTLLPVVHVVAVLEDFHSSYNCSEKNPASYNRREQLWHVPVSYNFL